MSNTLHVTAAGRIRRCNENRRDNAFFVALPLTVNAAFAEILEPTMHLSPQVIHVFIFFTNGKTLRMC
jgi:hypothetical protein